MRLTKILFYCFLISLITSAATYKLIESQQRKIAVVDAVKLFEAFNMKKELEAKARTTLLSISQKMDTVGNQLKVAQVTRNEADIKHLTELYGHISAQLEKEYQQTNKDIDEQVWKRLNPLLMKYGKEKSLHLIIGANGMGSVLYNDEYFDVTGDVIKFVNNVYEKGD